MPTPPRPAGSMRRPASRRALAFTIALFAAAGCSPPPPEATRTAESVPARGDWMAGLADTLGPRPLRSVILPGTHDSATAAIAATSEVTADAPDWMQSIASSGAFLPVGVIAAAWSRAQGRSIPDQLTAGIRYLDLRLCHASDGLRTCHGLAGDHIETLLDQVATFLAAHAREIVILDFNHFYALSAADHAYLSARISSVLGDRLAPRALGAGVTLAELWQEGRQAVVLYADDPTVDGNAQLWYENAIQSPWANTTDPGTLESFLAQRPLLRPNDTLFVSQAILTPDSGTIQRGLNPFSANPHSLQQLAATINPRVEQWIQDASVHGSLNVIITDWTPDSLVGTTINLNSW